MPEMLQFLPKQSEEGLMNPNPATGPLLTIAHKQAKLEFAREHVDWDLDERPGERYSQAYMVPQLAFRGGSIMFWSAISLEARTDLLVIQGRSLTSQKYIQDILENPVATFAPHL
ncbi:hypothetical protein YQE_01199, partial [Dendroctonus ponderosae]